MDESSRQAAKEAFGRGDYPGAVEHYTRALKENPGCIPSLLSRSLCFLKGGHAREARDDAVEATSLLCEGGAGVDAKGKSRRLLLAKAHYRRAAALQAMGSRGDAAEYFLRALKNAPSGDGQAASALRRLAHEMTPAELAAMLASMIEEAETRNPYFPRDGALLRPVGDPAIRLGGRALAERLEMVMAAQADAWRGVLATAWTGGRGPSKAELACLRSLAYLALGSSRDADLNIPRPRDAHGDALDSNAALVQARRDADAAIAYSGDAPWPEPFAARAVALSRSGQPSEAALAMRRAFELRPHRADLTLALRELVARVPEEERAILMEGGSGAFEEWQEDRREAARPEYLKKRPKYYYYYNWMKKRIGEHYPAGLPEPVMDKLLTMDAGDLDLLLHYPEAIRGQAGEFLEVLETRGPQALLSYKTKAMTFDEVKEHAGAPGLVGLGMGPPPAIEGGGEERDTDHALLGAAGDGGLTAAERCGNPAALALPPDQDRARIAAAATATPSAARGQMRILEGARRPPPPAPGGGYDAAGIGVPGRRAGEEGRGAPKSVRFSIGGEGVAVARPAAPPPSGPALDLDLDSVD